MRNKLVNIPFPIKKADSFFARFKGLMFKKAPIRNEGLWIIPCNAVHMFFMSFAIDVVLINERMEVVCLYPDLQPWTATKPEKKAYSTLELPSGTIASLGIEIGDMITFNTTIGKLAK
ncbi:DUF192 domain-containing protein [Neobacillus notoginsengisoli]|nr:DUF192 domain-containing protein [Neobacillus notoginsengisoli]